MEEVVLSEGDVMEFGDEYEMPYSKEWHKIPKKWVGLKVSYNGDCTFSRFRVRVRRQTPGKERK